MLIYVRGPEDILVEPSETEVTVEDPVEFISGSASFDPTTIQLHQGRSAGVVLLLHGGRVAGMALGRALFARPFTAIWTTSAEFPGCNSP